MTKDSNKTTDDLDFETAYTSLEQLVMRMEQGNQTLEQSLTDFEQGINLIKQCHAQLKAAEQKVELLSQDSNGTLQAESLSLVPDSEPNT